MEQFPLTDSNTSMAALVSLVAVVATEELYGAVIRDGNFINGKQAKPLAFESFVGTHLTGVSASLGKAVLTQLLDIFLLFLRGSLEVNNHTAASHKIVKLAKSDEHGTTFGPNTAIGGT